MARLYRDSYGVPHVRATSMTDLARAQGAVTAHDRSWQLEWQRRRATGTTAELVGPGGVGWDVLVRRTGLVDVARRAHDGLDPETQAFLAAYVEGVGAGLRDDAPELVALGVAPGEWEPWLPIAVFGSAHLLFGSIGKRLWDRRTRRVLGDDAALLAHEGPVVSGSNAWAVGGDRTASGLPLIGGDPHRTIESPGVYQQVRLVCEDPEDPVDVVGFAFPGVPGVQHFAHAGTVAWAITNAASDYQDLHDVELTDDVVVASYGERVAVRGGAPVEVEVLLTDRGPAIEGARGGPGLVLQQPALRLADLGFGAFLPLLRARSVADVDRALDAWVEPVNNVVAADTAGRVLYRVAGRVPTRDTDGQWTGWVEPLPRTEVAPDEQVVTANERRGSESAAIGSSFAPPYRATRLHTLLDDRSGLTPADFQAMHGDAVQLGTGPLLDLLARALPGDAGVEELLVWDRRMAAESTRAGRFARWRSALARLIAAAPVLEPLQDPGGHGLPQHNPVFDPYLDVAARVGLALPGLVAADAPYGLDLLDLARRAWAEAAAETDGWGETHLLAPVHALGSGPGVAPVPRIGLAGDLDCVRCVGSLPGVSDLATRGSVARYVWDLADRQAGGWVVPMGSAGDPASEHHLDQVPLWAEARLTPIVTDWGRLAPEEPAIAGPSGVLPSSVRPGD